MLFMDRSLLDADEFDVEAVEAVDNDDVVVGEEVRHFFASNSSHGSSL